MSAIFLILINLFLMAVWFLIVYGIVVVIGYVIRKALKLDKKERQK